MQARAAEPLRREPALALPTWRGCAAAVGANALTGGLPSLLRPLVVTPQMIFYPINYWGLPIKTWVLVRAASATFTVPAFWPPPWWTV